MPEKLDTGMKKEKPTWAYSRIGMTVASVYHFSDPFCRLY